ncbi:cation:proton antiporter [Chloroflexota bacterium]
MTDLVLAIGVMTMVGLLGGLLAHRFKFPMVTGYIMVGILFSPSVFNVIPQATIDNLEVFTSIALGIIAYSIGSSLRFNLIRKLERSIAWITPLQSLGAWFLTTLVIVLLIPLVLNIAEATFWSTYFPIAFILGAIASATAPAVVMAIVHEYRAKGPFTTTLLSVVGLDDAIAIISFTIAISIVKPLIAVESSFSGYEMLVPFLGIIESIAIGILLSLVLIYVAKLVKSRSMLLVIVLGIIMLCVGISNLLEISSILANMVIGLIVVNMSKREELSLVIDDIEDFIFAMFFVLAGLHFNLGAMRSAGILALLIVVSRFSGKYVGTAVGARLASAPAIVRKYLGLALLPKAGVSIGLALLAQSIFPTIGALIFNTVLASTIINELIAPPLARYAIFKSGERHDE